MSEQLAQEARAHAEALRTAVDSAGTRAEHIRLSVLYAEADRLATTLEGLTPRS